MTTFALLTGEYAEINAAIKQELSEAGIGPFDIVVPPAHGVKTSIIGQLGPWAFRRADTYWIAEGPGMPMDIANVLHTTMGHEIRVGGVAGGADPRTHFQGFTPTVYHIDTQDALDIFSQALRGVIERSKQPA